MLHDMIVQMLWSNQVPLELANDMMCERVTGSSVWLISIVSLSVHCYDVPADPMVESPSIVVVTDSKTLAD